MKVSFVASIHKLGRGASGVFHSWTVTAGRDLEGARLSAIEEARKTNSQDRNLGVGNLD
jgi:hypothetical protein